jgi:hypothetical protein
MSKPKPSDVRKRIQVEFDRELAQQVEDFRRKQPAIPTVSACVRELVARGLATENALTR